VYFFIVWPLSPYPTYKKMEGKRHVYWRFYYQLMLTSMMHLIEHNNLLGHLTQLHSDEAKKGALFSLGDSHLSSNDLGFNEPLLM
jgi:hypothetical protein